MTLLVSLASYVYTSILTFAHFSRFTHIYNNNTSTHYHLAWEFEKPFIISFITLRFIQPKINELLFLFVSIDIMNHKARLAWELYLKMETSGESFSLLQLIANDCYKVCMLDIL